MIKKWIQKLSQSNSQTKKTNHTINPNKPLAKEKPVKKEKTAQAAWHVEQFKVAEKAGKTRFHDFSLHNELMHGIADLRFDYCTPIQAQSLPHTLKGLDLIGKAQTGTGKTAAFLITIIDQLLSNPKDKPYLYEPRALIVAPTRELVNQIADDAKKLCRHTQLHIVSVVGGEAFDKQHKQLDSQPVDILVATPGRLIDFLERNKLYLDQVETLVLDEADRMLDMGFIPQVKRIVRCTPHKDNRQTLLFSATFTQDIINLSERWTLDARTVEIEPEHVATDNVEQLFYMVADKDKLLMIERLLKQKAYKRSIIFANRRDQTHDIFSKLKKAGFKVGILSGDINQDKRSKTLEDFKQGKISALIATDVVGRGIHIKDVSHVINYNLPQEPENYVHRIGRTGRAGATGVAVSLIGEEDAYDVPALEALLEHKLNMQWPPEDTL